MSNDCNNRDMKKMTMTLCSYHVELKYYLDQKSLIKNYNNNNNSKSTSNNYNNGVLESLKYLPKKPPLFNNSNNNNGGGVVGGNDNSNSSSSNLISESKRAMLTIRAASTLLQELWDGKLRVTVRSFTRKVIKDMSYRVYLEDSFDTFCKIYHHHNNSSSSSNSDGGNSSSNNNYNNNSGTKSKRSSNSNITHVNNNVTVVTKNIFIHPLFSDVRTLVVIPNRPTWAIWQNSEYLKK